MSEEIKQMLQDGLKTVEAEVKSALDNYNAELVKQGKVSNETTGKVDDLSAKLAEMKSQLIDLAQKQISMPAEQKIITVGADFIKSSAFTDVVSGQRERARYEVKNTVLSDTTTTFPTQRPGVIPGNFLPVTIRSRIPTVTVTGNAVNALREASNTNNAAEVAQGASKPESAVTFEQYNVPIQTVAHWIKVSNQLLADAPAIASYIDTRLRDGLAQRIERQLLLGDGTTPNLSGLTDSGNFTAFTPVTGANLADSINKAKYALWATGNVADTAIVNPADWAAMEIAKTSAGEYLYGTPGTAAGTTPFGVQIVLSNHMPAGYFLIGNLMGATNIFQRQGVTVEMGYINEDFTNNLVTIRAEERLGLAVDRPAAIYYGTF